MTLRARLTAWSTMTLIVVLTLAAAFVLYQQQRLAVARVDRELADLTTTVVNVIQDELKEAAAEPAREAIATLGIEDRAIVILGADGRPIAAAWNGLAPAAAGGMARPHSTATVNDGRGDWRLRIDDRRIGDRIYGVLTGAPLVDVARERRQLVDAMLIGIPVCIVLAALGGWWLASIGLAPITTMAGRAARIGADGTDDLGDARRDDEIGQLTRAFNDLVGRLRAALAAQRRFMADASHELRTPVAVMRSAAEVTLARDHRDEAEYREALAIVDDQGRRVTRLVDDMLVLARADAGGYPLQYERMYVDELIADCRRAVAVLASRRAVTIDVSAGGDSSVDGDRELLGRMLINVVQNAVHHSVSGTRVAIEVQPNGREVVIDVSNVGTPIAEADRDRIFERFVQLDPSRRANGSGLGLPIARWIAEAHGGTLTLKQSGASATTFSIALPLA